MTHISASLQGDELIRRHVVPEPFMFGLIREFFESDDDQFEDLQPIGSKEFYSILGLLLGGVAILALTIGPFAIV